MTPGLLCPSSSSSSFFLPGVTPVGEIQSMTDCSKSLRRVRPTGGIAICLAVAIKRRANPVVIFASIVSRVPNLDYNLLFNVAVFERGFVHVGFLHVESVKLVVQILEYGPVAVLQNIDIDVRRQAAQATYRLQFVWNPFVGLWILSARFIEERQLTNRHAFGSCRATASFVWTVVGSHHVIVWYCQSVYLDKVHCRWLA